MGRLGVIVKLDGLDSASRYRNWDLGHTDAVVVLTTLATSDEAVKFVKALLERRLVACGTILPGTRSLYRWEDKLADETEVVVVLKTRSGAIHGLEKAFKELHPYKVPELLAVPVSGGLERYLGWINDETSLTIV
jgi:periplasmic divalent cation tolerance protein